MNTTDIGNSVANTILTLSNEKHLTSKILMLLKVFSFLLICLLYLMEGCGFKSLVSLNQYSNISLPLENNSLFNFFVGPLFIVAECVIYEIYKKTLKLKAVEFGAKETNRNNILILILTIEDITRILFYVLILLKIAHKILGAVKGENVFQNSDVIFYFLVTFITGICPFIKRIYVQNAIQWHSINREYSSFYDSNGKRIANGDYVIYKGKGFKVEHIVSYDAVKKISYKKDWELIDFSGHSIKLQGAIAEDCNLKIIPYYEL